MQVLKIFNTWFDGRILYMDALIRHYYESGIKVKVETYTLNFHEKGFIFANEFLDNMNKTFGTNYPFSEDYKKEVGKRHGNIDYHKRFEIKEHLDRTYSLYEWYDFDDVKNCCATYGDFTKDTLMAFADALVAYNKGEKKTTNYEHSYTLVEEMAELVKKADAERKSTEENMNNAVKALESSLSGISLDKSVEALKDGYRYTFSSINDKLSKGKKDINRREMVSVLNEIRPTIKKYECFNFKVVEEEKTLYFTPYLSCIHSEDKNNQFNIAPLETEDGIRFELDGWIENGNVKIDFHLNQLTYEEMLTMVDYYNKSWYNAKYLQKIEA